MAIDFKKIIAIYVVLDLILIAVCMAFGSKFVLNSQVAFICSALILLTSYKSLKKRIEDGIDLQNSQTIIDFSQEDLEDFNSKISDELKAKLKEKKISSINEDILADNKMQKVKFNIGDMISFFKPFKILSYILLILSFFILRNNGLFEAIPFLLGLGIMPIGSLLGGLCKC